METKREIQTSVKDESLIVKRRNQMIRGAVKLFKEKGFHRTTTREIAKEAGFSIGTLYEYIRTKEDVLYLVCDGIYEQVKLRLSDLSEQDDTVEGLKSAIRHYYRLIDDMSDEFVVMYQESKSLPKDALEYVLTKESEMVSLFEERIRKCVGSRQLQLSEKEIPLVAHHIVVQGQMWAFRRWALKRLYTIDEYIGIQTDLIFHRALGE